MSTVYFQQRTDKADREGRAPIRVVYQIRGQRRYFPTSVKCLPDNWSVKDQQAVFLNRQAARKVAPGVDYELFLTEAEVREVNLKLGDFLSDIADVEKRFTLDKIIYTPQMVLEGLAAIRQPEARREDPGDSVVGFIHRFVADNTGTRKAGTLKVYSGLAAHLAAFEKRSGRRASFDTMDYSFLRAFHSYLSDDRTIIKEGKTKEVKGMNNITSAKQLSTLKTLLNFARTQYKINVHPDYRDYKVSRNDGDFEVIALTEEEFLKLFYMDLTGKDRLARVRDVFCFSCATGLRISDLRELKWAHIRDGAIKKSAAKNSHPLDIPLNYYSATILEKYQGLYRPLPVISGQKSNDYIKELCELAGIDTPIEVVREYGVRRVATVYKKHELVSIHTGRKTFSTLSLEKGIAMLDVMSITAHKTFKSFKRYVDVASKHKQKVMAKGWGTAGEPKG